MRSSFLSDEVCGVPRARREIALRGALADWSKPERSPVEIRQNNSRQPSTLLVALPSVAMLSPPESSSMILVEQSQSAVRGDYRTATFRLPPS